jgi:hypothetical protein
MEMIVAYIAIIFMFVTVPCMCFKLIGYCFYSGGDNETKVECEYWNFWMGIEGSDESGFFDVNCDNLGWMLGI